MSGEDETEYVEHVIEHQQQRFNWDCGVSCVMMLLNPHQREEMLTNFDQICQQEGFGQSTWTIDLCFLLKRFGIQHQMYTTLLGVNDDYRRHGYYNKIINKDKERVLRRFRSAAAAGVRAAQHALSPRELDAHLAAHGPVIALVDAGLLACDLCNHNKLKADFRRCFGGSYSGHYVVVVGRRRGALLYRDPARRRPGCPGRAARPARPGRPARPAPCEAAPARLHAARRASGTDEDVILVYR